MIAERVQIECDACLVTFDTELVTERAQPGRYVEHARHGCPECRRVYRREWTLDDAPTRMLDMPSNRRSPLPHRGE